jgi:hypothetical protein
MHALAGADLCTPSPRGLELIVQGNRDTGTPSGSWGPGDVTVKQEEEIRYSSNLHVSSSPEHLHDGCLGFCGSCHASHLSPCIKSIDLGSYSSLTASLLTANAHIGHREVTFAGR